MADVLPGKISGDERVVTTFAEPVIKTETDRRT